MGRPQRARKAPARFREYETAGIDSSKPVEVAKQSEIEQEQQQEAEEQPVQPPKKRGRKPKTVKPVPADVDEPQQDQIPEEIVDEGIVEDEPASSVVPNANDKEPQPSIFALLPNEIKRAIMLEIASPRDVLTLSIADKSLFDYAKASNVWEVWCRVHLRLRTKVPCDSRKLVVDAIGKTCEYCKRYDRAGLTLHSVSYQNLCQTCTNSSDFRLITVTRAKSEYKINESDIAGLRYLSRPNPHYRSSYPMRLYVVRQVKDISERKTAMKEAKLAAKEAQAAAKQCRSRKTDVKKLEDNPDSDYEG